MESQVERVNGFSNIAIVTIALKFGVVIYEN